MRTRLSICRRKARYATAADALAAAEVFGLPLLPYRCDRCHAVHLTSRTKAKRMRNPAVRDSVSHGKS